jgi:membrane-bound serine protease (ClpP class)
MRAFLFSLMLCYGAFGAPLSDSAVADTALPASPARAIHVIPVEGDVEPAMAAFIGRAVREALADADALAVLEMDTFGGRVDAAFQIVDTLLQFPKERVVAYVKNKAISAGALIALACGRLYMRPGTTIGDCAPIMVSEEGPQMLGEKFQSPLRAKFRALAKRNGFPEELAESMVSDDNVVYGFETSGGALYMDSLAYADLSEEERKALGRRTTVVKRGELLTMDDVEAEELGFSSGTVESIEALADTLGGSAASIVRVEQSWSETFVRIITKIAPILMILGIAGIYIETKTPGIGFPGIVGALCLALVFFSQYMVGLANHTELIILAAGMLLLLIDVFVIPGFGVAGFAGIGLIAVALVLSLQNFVLPNPEFPWQQDLLVRNLRMVGITLAASLAVIVLFFVFVFPRLGRVVDGPTLAHILSSRVDSDRPVQVHAGDRGVVTKPLRPSGTARFGTVQCDVVSDGDFIDVGEEVVVSGLQGNRVVVNKAEAKHV